MQMPNRGCRSSLNALLLLLLTFLTYLIIFRFRQQENPTYYMRQWITRNTEKASTRASNQQEKMRKVIVYSVYAVGMHQNGNRFLTVGAGYYGRREPDNPFDSNAVAVHGDKSFTHHCSAYLKRSDAAMVVEICKENFIEGPIMIKAKFEPVFRRGGPVQRCNLGFCCMDNNLNYAFGYC